MDRTGSRQEMSEEAAVGFVPDSCYQRRVVVAIATVCRS